MIRYPGCWIFPFTPSLAEPENHPAIHVLYAIAHSKLIGL